MKQTTKNVETVSTHIYEYSLNNNRIVYLDILNILAIVSVIAMHCNGIVHKNPMTNSWSTSLVVECVCYFAVPIFFMISGSNLMKYRERYTTKEFFKKRAQKVLLPFIIWTIIMFIWNIFITKNIEIETINSPVKLLTAFFQNKEEPTYYFMFEILGVYLIMPVLALLAKKEYQNTLWATVGLFFIFNATIPDICALIGIKWYSSFGVPFTEYVIYVILGYLLSENNLSKKQKIILYIGAIVGVVYRYVTTFLLSKSAGQVVKVTWGYSSWHCMLLSVAIFVFIKNLKICEKIKNNKKVGNVIAKIAGCSFGIYLIHMIVKYYYIKIFNINVQTWHFRTLGALAIYEISLAIVMILKKMPIIKKALP